jgi:outer membrane protein assembly factor BamE (lipoprotein component of BamABCDE complex)
MNRTSLLVAVGLLGLTGCLIGSGKKVDSAKVQQIKTCETTEKQVLEWFGEPENRGIQNGYVSMNWTYARQTGFTAMETQNLLVYVGKDGRVVDFAWNPPGGNYTMTDRCSTQ